MSVIDSQAHIADYDSHKKYVRIGECNHCGVCCSGCPQLRYKATRNIKSGEAIVPSKDFVGECIGYGVSKEYVDKGCASFPSHPLGTPMQCGYKWVEAQ
jgi:hypothetical protein